MTSSTGNTFHGWARFGKDQPLQWCELQLKQFEDDDIEVNITHCGICGSDIHTLDNGWRGTNYPCVVGHEIVGTVAKVGSNVKEFGVGDRVGIGPQSQACLECEQCNNDEENVCLYGKAMTYNSRWKCGDKTYGGYADKWRGNRHFVFKIPQDISSGMAAALLCSGVTTYTPLKSHGVTIGSRVGVLGIGNLGHLTIQFAKAFGAEVVAFSSTERKRDDAKLLGADEYAVVSDTKALADRARTLTHLVCTNFANDNFDWASYLQLLKPNGKFIMLAVPETPLTNIPPNLLVLYQISLVGSFIGSRKDTREMLEVVSKSDVAPWFQVYPMNQAEDAVQAMRDGKAKFKIVLEN